MHLREQLRTFEEELSRASPRERESMVRAMTQVLMSLKREHEQMLETIDHALYNLSSLHERDAKEAPEVNLMEKINRIIQPMEKAQIAQQTPIPEEAGSTVAYLRKYNLFEDGKENPSSPAATSSPQSNRIFSSPVSKILK